MPAAQDGFCGPLDSIERSMAVAKARKRQRLPHDACLAIAQIVVQMSRHAGQPGRRKYRLALEAGRLVAPQPPTQHAWATSRD